MQDLNDHPFEAFRQSEAAALTYSAWEKWITTAESHAKHYGIGRDEPGNLDGNEAEDGFSYGTAHDAFRAGWTVERYVENVMAKQSQLGLADWRSSDPASENFPSAFETTPI
jgi:hypothetical protein